MYLDERSTALLLEIIKNPNMSNEFIEDKFNLSHRQIDYSVDKINTWLDYHEKPQIEYYNGRYHVDQSIYSLFDYRYLPSDQNYIPSKDERIYLLIVTILLRQEPLSLEHLSQDLQVSKNTVLNDIKTANAKFMSKNLSIEYSRLNGYLLSGEEWSKRMLLLDAIICLGDNANSLKILSDMLSKNDFRVYRIRKMLERIEADTNQNFIDARLKTLPYELEAILQRIEKGNFVKRKYFISFDDLFGTREYEFISEFLKNEGIEKEEEKLFLTLHLLTVNRSYTEFIDDPEAVISDLETAIYESLSLFERNAVIQLRDKKSLTQTIMQHLKPAYYRIKYNLTTDFNFPDEVQEELSSFHYLVSISIDPLRTFFERDIPYYEELFITLFISSHLSKAQRNDLSKDRKKAVIVCPNGVTISSLVKSNLRHVFPEINFMETMSIREYEKTDKKHDLVFSTTPLLPQDNQKIYVVNQMMSDLEKRKLRERVILEVFNHPHRSFSIDDLMATIMKHTNISNKEALEQDLENLLYPKSELKNYNRVLTKEGQINLDDLLGEDFIQFVDEDLSWHQIIDQAALPLLNQNIIEKEYIEKMQDMYDDVSDHILLSQKIAIPHAGIDDGVNGLGMSLLILRRPYKNLDYSINYVVVIATPDKKLHFDSLMQLMELSSNEDVLKKILASKNEEAVHKLIKRFVKDGDNDEIK